MKNTRLAILAFAVILPVSVQAAETAWTEIMPGARVRAVSAGSQIDNKALIGLEIDLAPGMLTYWRVPGETGLPTELSVKNGTEAHETELFWPLPEWDVAQGYVDLVYHGGIVLPALVDAPVDAALTLALRMGVCSDICVPVQAQFVLPGDKRTDPANSLRLRQALNETPIPWPDADAPLTDIAFDRESGSLSLAFDPARIDPDRVFPSLDGTTEVFNTPEIDESVHRLNFTLLASRSNSAWQQAPLRLTFATIDGPYEIVQNP